MDSSRMILKQELIGPMMNFIYIIGCPESKEAAVVDPAWDTPAILKLAEDSGLKIKHILMTHAHPDHMNGLEQMLKDTDAFIYLNRNEVEYMKDCGNATGIPTAFMQQRSENFRVVDDGDTVYCKPDFLERNERHSDDGRVVDCTNGRVQFDTFLKIDRKTGKKICAAR